MGNSIKISGWPENDGWYWLIQPDKLPIPVEVGRHCLWREGKLIFRGTILMQDVEFWTIEKP